MHEDTRRYNEAQAPGDRAVCELLAERIDRGLPETENRIWHGHPVWFLDGNPVVGYSKLKDCVRLLFWSGQSFETGGLAEEGKLKAAEARYRAVDEVDTAKLARWLEEARDVQWDYRNLVRRKGRLERLKSAARDLSGVRRPRSAHPLRRAARGWDGRHRRPGCC
jgi:hypothetical protein